MSCLEQAYTDQVFIIHNNGQTQQKELAKHNAFIDYVRNVSLKQGSMHGYLT
jgi:hypothetical protein